jgi:hypothetical protein
MMQCIAVSVFSAVLGLAGCNSTPYYGSILLGDQPANPTTAFSASAEFYLGLGATPPSCAGTQSGSCCYVPVGTNVTPLAPASAGTITLTDKGLQLGQLTYDGVGYPGITSVFGESPNLAWSAGDTIDVTASGAAIQAFSGSAVAPADIIGLDPMPDPTTALTVTGATGFTIGWTPGSGNSSFLLVLEDATKNVITCEVPIAAGTLSVPGSLLTHLSGPGSIETYPQVSSSFDGPNASVTIELRGASIQGMATFE